jgi:hypothetical protein
MVCLATFPMMLFAIWKVTIAKKDNSISIPDVYYAVIPKYNCNQSF